MAYDNYLMSPEFGVRDTGIPGQLGGSRILELRDWWRELSRDPLESIRLPMAGVPDDRGSSGRVSSRGMSVAEALRRMTKRGHSENQEVPSPTADSTQLLSGSQRKNLAMTKMRKEIRKNIHPGLIALHLDDGRTTRGAVPEQEVKGYHDQYWRR